MDGGQPTGAEPCSWPRTALFAAPEPCSFQGGTPLPPNFSLLRTDGAPPVAAHLPRQCTWHPGPSGGLVAESDVDPPGPIPNPVVTHVSAGEYYGPGPWEARPLRALQTARDTRTSHLNSTRGGAVAARWAHNPKVGGSNPPPATTQKPITHAEWSVFLYLLIPI